MNTVSGERWVTELWRSWKYWNSPSSFCLPRDCHSMQSILCSASPPPWGKLWAYFCEKENKIFKGKERHGEAQGGSDGNWQCWESRNCPGGGAVRAGKASWRPPPPAQTPEQRKENLTWAALLWSERRPPFSPDVFLLAWRTVHNEHQTEVVFILLGPQRTLPPSLLRAPGTVLRNSREGGRHGQCVGPESSDFSEVLQLLLQGIPILIGAKGPFSLRGEAIPHCVETCWYFP